MTQLRTMHDRVLVRRVVHAMSDGGIHLPQGMGPAEEWVGARTQRGEFTVECDVLAVGPGPACTEPRALAAMEALLNAMDLPTAAATVSVMDRIGQSPRLLREASALAPDVKAGDRIFWPSWARKWEIRLDGEDLFEVQGEDVAAVLRDGVVVPLRHRILVRHETTPDRVGSLYVPEAAQKRTQWARAVAVGTGTLLRDGRRVPIDVKPGDRVLLHEHGETRVTIHGAKNVIMRIEDVLAVDESPAE